ACFLIHLPSMTTLLTDPYSPGGLGGAMTYHPVPVSPDIVAITHEHADHSDTSWLQGGFLTLRSAHQDDRFELRVHHVDHDEYNGRLRGGRTRVLDIRSEGFRVLHFGDIGERLNDDQLRAIREAGDSEPMPVDVAIVPVGGYFTLGPDGAIDLLVRLQPRVGVPCHYRSLGLDLPVLNSVDAFVERAKRRELRVEERSSLSLLQAGGESNAPEIVVLEMKGMADLG
ncbi:MAG: MBL fold metallo-hydrolase, partial [Myxococcales bacterium]|nr:MBL fold metallo-hydrolase [Myxococcales bacterium]